MNVTFLGKKSVEKKDKSKTLYIVYIGHEREDVIGMETMVAFTNKDTYDSITSADIGHEKDMAIFFENGYTKIYNKKKGD